MDRALAVPYSRKSWERGVKVFFVGCLFLDKRSGGVLQAMGPNKQVRTQQSRASGAVYLRRYDRFCGPWESLGVLGASLVGSQGRPSGSQGRPRGSQGRAQGVPGKPQGPRQDLFGHWGPFRGPVAIVFPASKCPKTSKIVKKHKTVVKTGSKPLFWTPKP